ncbi:MAG: hypothetical protein J7L50_03230 [Candidatus Odinarchaeota archaeon]|nr:hypothetical protein [Candidatus Odinarchaeota archaeon]
MIIGAHIIDKSGIPKFSYNIKNEPIEPELMSAIITTLRAMTKTLSESNIESFTVGGILFYAMEVGEDTVVVATENVEDVDKEKLKEIVSVVRNSKSIDEIEEKIKEIINKKYGVLNKSKLWANEVWGP